MERIEICIDAPARQQSLLRRYQQVRAHTEWLASALSAEDQQIQTMADVSPTKWHRAHTTWFFERFVLQDLVAGSPPVDPAYDYLYNSYYEAVGPRHRRDQRGLLSRPGMAEVARWRERVDASISVALSDGELPAQTLARIELGLHHEQQHQELLLSDILHVLSCHPHAPVYRAGDDWAGPPRSGRASLWQHFGGGLVEIGHAGSDFSFDNEGPRHKVWLEPYVLASELVNEADWLAFIDAGGYDDPQYWCADGWAQVCQAGWRAPLYWRGRDQQWWVYSHAGERPLDGARPVSHVSWYEADAYARWADARLPTEAEWEHAVATSVQLQQAFGAVWQWTASAYAPYPGYRTEGGALGEYNGKFMCNQFVLRGSAAQTPEGHARLSYRNFYYPQQRWQFAGLRLARNAA
jgi:ergothioneine biosynthesis protein EgtB